MMSIKFDLKKVIPFIFSEFSFRKKVYTLFCKIDDLYEIVHGFKIPIHVNNM